MKKVITPFDFINVVHVVAVIVAALAVYLEIHHQSDLMRSNNAQVISNQSADFTFNLIKKMR